MDLAQFRYMMRLCKNTLVIPWATMFSSFSFLPLPTFPLQAPQCSRQSFTTVGLVERNFDRLKGHPLSLSPMYVERDDHPTGLVRLLSIALRVLNLMEFMVRPQLAQEGATLAGLYAGHPKRTTTHPTTERLLEAFQEITLILVIEPQQTRRHLTALSPLKPRVLALLEFASTIYTILCEDSSQPPVKMSEP